MLIQLTEINAKGGHFVEEEITIDCSPGTIHTIQEGIVRRVPKDDPESMLITDTFEPLEREARGVTFRNGQMITVKETQRQIRLLIHAAES